MTTIPFVGPTYQMDAASFDNQRSVNLFPILSESGLSVSPAALRSTPGLREFADVGSGPHRAAIESAGRAFFVSGNEFFELLETGSSLKRGDLNSFTGRCQIAENPTQVMIIDGEDGYIFTKSTNAFAEITDPDFPIPSSLTFQDGYFIVSIKDSSEFAISALNDGSSWDALDRTTVEGSPDNVVAVKSNKANLWAFGTKTIEVFQNTGAATFPFQKIVGAYIQVGCAAPDTLVNLYNNLIWLGVDENGDSSVWRSDGYNAVRISTQAIERIIRTTRLFEDSYAWTYYEQGHAFYCLQVAGLSTTLVYDVSTQQWHERMFRNPNNNNEEQHRGSTHIFIFNQHLVGDRETGKVYEMSLEFYDDFGNPLIKKRISPTLVEENLLQSHSLFELDMETGVGLTSGQGSDPQVMMRYSDDRGRTWSSELWRSCGKIGEYNQRVTWYALGQTRGRVYEVSVSDPVFVQINGAYLNSGA